MMELHHGDCLEVLRGLADNSVDSIVTDPPYGLSFMGKKWDYDVPGTDVWAECLRVLKPGGHLLAFAGTRTQHRMAVRIEDAGFEIRDMIAWVYGSGFPKSLDVSKAIDKASGAEREVTREGQTKAPEDAGKFDSAPSTARERRDEPATEAARQPVARLGTALKPALEPITVARKPLVGTVAANVLEHGTGALNIDGCRVGWPGGVAPEIGTPGWGGPSKKLTAVPGQEGETVERAEPNNAGRWPANLIHDGSDEVVAQFPANAGASAPVRGTEGSKASVGNVTGKRERVPGAFHADTGSAARFFYCAKASRADRNEGVPSGAAPAVATGATMRDREDADWSARNGNHHPTVKPTDLMAYLCRLVTPPGGVVLDPFMGSGSTGKAAMREGFRFIGVEREAAYVEIARSRIEFERIKGLEAANEPVQGGLFGEAA